MTEPYDEGDAPNRPKWIGWALVIFMALVVIGVLNVGWLIMRPTPAADALAAVIAAKPELAVGQSAVEASDCMRCHGVQRKAVGPSFADIASKYAQQADAKEYLARKIREGSVGTWGNVIMPRHPQISEEQSLQMAAWLMAVPRVGASSSSNQ
ncbi:c-type cytochrome [Diaphorobacter sp. HDW4A]|uniref:c-type cytochrome n=1 Tax=Diaphorobacter sp. HDW4A TaxID=2714924 RepID=UPI001F106F4D|nr:c-type cytochrome [Diaphorobacter sp. HDW4A]